MKHYLFSRTADFALTGEKRLLNQAPSTPEPLKNTIASTTVDVKEKLAASFKVAYEKNTTLGTALRNAVLEYMKHEVKNAAAKIDEVKKAAADLIQTLPEIKGLSLEEYNKLIAAIPVDQGQLLAIAERAGFLDTSAALAAAREGGKGAPGEVSENEYSKLNDPDLYAAIDGVRIQLRRQAAGAPKDKQREAMDKYRKLNAVLDARKGMTIPDLVRRAPRYLPNSTQPTAQQQMADAMSRNAQRERFEETNTGDPLFGNSAAGKSFQNMLARKRHETERRMSGEERARYEVAKEWNKDRYIPPSYSYVVPENFRPAPRMGSDGKMHEVDMDQWMHYQPGQSGGFFDRNSANRGRLFEDPTGGRNGSAVDGQPGMFGGKVYPSAYRNTVKQSLRSGSFNQKVQDGLVNFYNSESPAELQQFEFLASHKDPRIVSRYNAIMKKYYQMLRKGAMLEKNARNRNAERLYSLSDALTHLQVLRQEAEFYAVNEKVEVPKGAKSLTVPVWKYGDWGDRHISITSNNDPSFRVVFNDPRAWGPGVMEMPIMADQAKDAGIRYERQYASVKRYSGNDIVTGLQLQFTKPGTYTVRCKSLPSGSATIVVPETFKPYDETPVPPVKPSSPSKEGPDA